MTDAPGRWKLQGLIEKLLFFSPFVFPLYLLRFELLGVPFTLPEAYCYLLFALYLYAVWRGQMSAGWGRPARWYYKMAFVILVGASLGVLTVPHYIDLPSGELLDAQRVALGVWKGWLLAPMLYFYVLTQQLSRADQVKKLLQAFVYSGALVALASYAYGMFSEGMTYDFRLSGFYESANYLSLYLVPALLLGIYFLLQGRSRLNLAAVTVMVHALFMTKSYAAILGIFGALGLYVLVILVRLKLSRKKLFMALALLFITFVAVVGSQLRSEKFRQFLDLENRSSSSVRLEIYEISWGLINEYPLTGVGPGLFQAYYQTHGPEYLGRAPMEWNIPHPHNVFLAFWLNAGLLGFLAFLGLLILAHRRITYPMLALWGLLIHGLFDTPFWKNDLAMIFWLLIGAILILQSHGTHSSKKSAAPIRKRASVRYSNSAKARRI